MHIEQLCYLTNLICDKLHRCPLIS